MTISNPSQLSTLVSLIADATKLVEAHFQKSCHSRVPSLDDTTSHPLDSENSPAEIRKAVQTIEGACAQLCATIAHPDRVMLKRFMDIYEPGCIRVAIHFKIPDILADSPCGMHISELAREAGVDMGKLGRILRLLASRHIFREVSRDVFANNRLSMTLLSDNPMASYSHHLLDDSAKAVSMLTETLADPQWGPSDAPDQTPWNKATKQQKSWFKLYEEDDIEAARLFGIGMKGLNTAIEAGSIIDNFPLGTATSVCDVGGGIGDWSVKLAKAYPFLDLKLQDIPQRIHQAQTEFWPQACPEAIRDNKIEFLALDFLTESPIKNCDIYFLKHILHNWADEACITILKNIRNAMAPQSRVLIHEYILQHASKDFDKFGIPPAPEPLLPNYGAGRILQYDLDMVMMTMLNSKQRSLDEYIKLGKEAGLQFMRVLDFGEMSVIELGLATK